MTTTRVAFQGVAGAYSEEATRQFFGTEVESVACKLLPDVFAAVESRHAEYGMVPVENAVAGSVTESYELLMEHDLRVNAEVILRVHHMLLGAPGAQLPEIKRVHSHPQALAQCEHYLSRRGLEPMPAFDTAGSARNLAENPDPSSAAIASALAAELYELDVLDQNIEDMPFNYTRFFVLGLEDPPRSQRCKTSLVFSTRHQPGALYESLGEFARRGVNLSKIESRPRRNQPWQYLFYLDFEGHWQDPECEAALMGLLRRSSFVKLLGSYPVATTPFDDEV
ncbi:MAG: prephenate dehydratase [Thermoflexales bacterium]|nr:prephenate dehydratase [Thermoflexales bacterium]